MVVVRPARNRVEGRLWRHAQELLALGRSVILEYGFWDRRERDENRSAARALGVGVRFGRFRQLARPRSGSSVTGQWGAGRRTTMSWVTSGLRALSGEMRARWHGYFVGYGQQD